MKAFYHVIGRGNAAEDFPKTVYTRVPIARIAAGLPELERTMILPRLEALFPTGDCNVWGVPAGAEGVFTRVEEGDAVFLVESTGQGGLVPALAQVKLIWPRPLQGLSEALWGANRFPLVFFFDTEPLALTWAQLHDELKFNNYRAPALLHSIGPAKLSARGGAEGFTAYMRTRYADLLAPSEPEFDGSFAGVRERRAPYDPNDSEPPLQIDIDAPPSLTSGAGRVQKAYAESSRASWFRAFVLQQYQGKCVICRSSLATPAGFPEVEAAHIYPKRLDGSDDPRNGISLCGRHHWAFDAGWISLTDSRTVLVRPDLPNGAEYDFIREYRGAAIADPLDERWRAHPLFLAAHRKLHRFG